MAQHFEARGNEEFVRPEATTEANGTRAISLGFRLCVVDDHVDHGAEVIAKALNSRDWDASTFLSDVAALLRRAASVMSSPSAPPYVRDLGAEIAVTADVINNKLRSNFGRKTPGFGG